MASAWNAESHHVSDGKYDVSQETGGGVKFNERQDLDARAIIVRYLLDEVAEFRHLSKLRRQVEKTPRPFSDQCAEFS